MDARIRAELLRETREQARALELAELIETHTSAPAPSASSTPLLVIDPMAARDRLHELRRALPFVRFHVPVTALPHDAVLRALWGETEFAVADARDLETLRSAGIPADGSLLLHPTADAALLKAAYASGIRTMVVTDPTHVDALTALPKDLQVLVRVSTGGNAGADPAHVVGLTRHALARGVNVSGIAVHTGSAGSPADVATGLARALDAIDAVTLGLGVHLRTLDIGGGLPSTARALETFAATVASAVRRRPGLAVIAEPGRAIAAPTALQVTRVIEAATRDGAVCYTIDDSVLGGFSRVMTDAVAPTLFSLAEVAGATERLYPARVIGASGRSCDVVASAALLPPLAVGDVLVSPYAGAYSFAAQLGTTARAAGLTPTEVVVVERRADLVPAPEFA